MSELKPLNPTEQDALVKQIGLTLMRAAPEEWRHIAAEYRATGRYFELAAEVRSADGALRAWSPPQEVAGLFSRLRAGMYREGRGSWSNARYQLDHPSSYNLDFDRAEPSWTTPPPPQAYVDEMRFFPRTDDNVPDWLRRRLPPVAPPRDPQTPTPRAFRTARVFDGAGPGGRPSVNRPPIVDADRDLLISYLDRAPVAVIGRGFDADVLNPDAPSVVPVAFQTDGHWIWPAAVGYYLRVYGVPPEPELVERAKAQDFVLPEVSEEARVAAAANLGAPAAPPGAELPVAEPVGASVEPPVAVGETTVAAPLPGLLVGEPSSPGARVGVEDTANLADLKPEVIEYAQEGPPYRVRFDEDGPVIDDRHQRESYVDGMDLFAPGRYEQELNDTQAWTPFSEEEPEPEAAEETAVVEAITDEPVQPEQARAGQPQVEHPHVEQAHADEPHAEQWHADQAQAEQQQPDQAHEPEPEPAEEPVAEVDNRHAADESEATAEFEIDQDHLFAPERDEPRFAEDQVTQPHLAQPHLADQQFAEAQFTEPQGAEHDEPSFESRTEPRHEDRDDAAFALPDATPFEEHQPEREEQAFGEPETPSFSEPEEARFEPRDDAQFDDHDHDHEKQPEDQGFVEQVPPPFADEAPTQFTEAVQPFQDAPPPPAVVPAPVQVEPPEVVEPRQVTPDEERELSGLRRALDELEVPSVAYRFGEPADRTWLLRVEGQDWEVSWFDHGPTNPVSFDRLEDAAAYLVGKLVLAKPRAPRPVPPMPPPPQLQQRPPRPPMNNGFREEPPRRPVPMPQRPPVEQPPAAVQVSTQDGKANRSWPINPMNGEPPLTLFRQKKMIELPAGMEVDRFGEGEGNLVYVAGTPFRQRSLVPSWINRPYRVYRLRRPIEVLTGIAVPWFEQPGGGTAYLMPKTIDDMLADGVLVEVANQEAPTH